MHCKRIRLKNKMGRRESDVARKGCWIFLLQGALRDHSFPQVGTFTCSATQVLHLCMCGFCVYCCCCMLFLPTSIHSHICCVTRRQSATADASVQPAAAMVAIYGQPTQCDRSMEHNVRSPTHEPHLLEQVHDHIFNQAEGLDGCLGEGQWSEGKDGPAEGMQPTRLMEIEWAMCAASQQLQWEQVCPLTAAAMLEANAIPDPTPSCALCMGHGTAQVHCRDCHSHLCSDCDAYTHSGLVHQHRRCVW